MAQTMYYWQWPPYGTGTFVWGYEYRWRTIGSWDTEPLSIDPGIPPHWPKDQIGTTKYERLRYDDVNQRLEMTGYWDVSLYQEAVKLCSHADYLVALFNLYYRLTPATDSYTVHPGSTTYDWSLMEDQHSDPPDPGDQEVAELCNHVSNTIMSDWGIAATGSCHNWQAFALKTFYYYHNDVKEQTCSGYGMIDEIQWMRPVGMGGGSADGGGHAWVVHGYDDNYANTRFLMNMGWGGQDDGWYTKDNVPGGFIQGQTNLVQIAPVSARFVGNAVPGDGSPDNPYMNIQDALAKVADGSTLIFKAGTTNTFSGSTLVIGKALTLKGCDVTIE
jgi:hypothetical protein